MATEYLKRLDDPRMEYYKELYRYSPKWKGEPLEGKKVIVYCEQGYGDIIQFSRYLWQVKHRGAYLILHCPKVLHRLLAHQADELLDKDTCEELPPHDYHILSMSLPFVLSENPRQGVIVPYLNVQEKADLEECSSYFKIGIAWEGSPEHSNNAERCCPLEYFKEIGSWTNTKLFMLQPKVGNQALLKNCEDLDLYGIPLNDFYDTATLINAMDVVITVDTAVLHLAGALGKKAFGLLSYRHDPRWAFATWYPTVRLIRQADPYDWDSVFDKVFEHMGYTRKNNRICALSDDRLIVLTGGIGDVLALESFMSDDHRKSIKKIYYATRAADQCKEIFAQLSKTFPSLEKQESVWTDFSQKFAFYSKAEVSEHLDNPPEDWHLAIDWSIYHKFCQIEENRFKYSGSSVLKTKMADISQMKLPKNYLVICPYSGNNPDMRDRNFTDADWQEVERYLYEHNLRAVIIGQGDFDKPKSKYLVDLTNKTSLPQAIEVLKKAKGYVGIDSCLSVLAAKLFDEHLFVRSSNEHLLNWKHIYYAPKTQFDFIGPAVRLP